MNAAGRLPRNCRQAAACMAAYATPGQSIRRSPRWKRRAFST
jgi:hypothetical protein